MKLTRWLLRPKASQVLTAYLTQCNEPPWTSYFVMLKDVKNDQWGMANFNWTLQSGTNYQILRATCFPYIKYHCSKKQFEDLTLENSFFNFLKIINLGLPMLFYGLAGLCLIKHTEMVVMPNDDKIPIYFLYPEDKGSSY
uniref:Uncharacterized protein n=1 Tax=Glossina brevipalpis TaxID=37001 RepID=A0A1A9WY09_9MUSC